MQARYVIDYTVWVDDSEPQKVRELLIEDDTYEGFQMARANGLQHVIRRVTSEDDPERVPLDRIKYIEQVIAIMPITTPNYGPQS